MHITLLSFLLVTITVTTGHIKYTSANSKDEDYYTSLVGIQKLAKQEQVIISTVLEYRKKLERRRDLIDRYLEEYSSSLNGVPNASLQRTIRKSKFRSRVPLFEGKEEMEEMMEFISGHPFRAYRLIRRIGKELLELMMDFGVEIESDLIDLMDNIDKTMRIPNQTDVDGAAQGLLRIQDTYAIPIDDFVQGKFGGTETNTSLSLGFDLHYIAVQALNAHHYSTAIELLNKAYNKAVDGDDSVSIDVVAEDLVLTIGRHNKAFRNPDIGEVLKPFLFKQELSLNLSTLVLPITPRKLKKEWTINYTEDTLDDIWNFKALCRDEILLPESVRKTLTCYYKRDTPHSLISPVKVEVHLKSPPILQFHDLISDSLIEKIVSSATPNLIRAKIFGSPGDRDIKSEIRTSAVTWIQDYGAEWAKYITKVIQDVTGLDASPGHAAEDLQVSSYGSIGGHYMPHLDTFFEDIFATDDVDDQIKFSGDRAATLMFYLSDVEQGGGTAFPRLGVGAKVTKGSAIFWYNMNKNGTRDKLTLHGGCPILYGIKWVANKWIRTHSQMFIRPCSLDPDK